MSSMSSFIIQLVLLEESLFFKYFIGLRIKALSSSGQIPKRVKLFLQHLFFTDGYLFVWNSSAIA